MYNPTAVKCIEGPTNRTEIPTPKVAQLHPHLKHTAPEIPHPDDQIQIQLSIGRNLPEVHHVLDQVTGPLRTPFARKMKLGWVVISGVCPGKHHTIWNVSVTPDGRPSVLKS